MQPRYALAHLACLAALLAGCAGEAARDAGGPGDGFSPGGNGATGTLRGVVVNEAIRPLAGVALVLRPGDHAAVSDEAGAFGFTGLEEGTYLLAASKLGHEEIKVAVQVAAEPGAPVELILPRLPEGSAYVDLFHTTLFIGLSFSMLGGPFFTSFDPTSVNGTFVASLELGGNVTWVQDELDWEPAQALAERMYLECGSYGPGSNGGGPGDAYASRGSSGPPVLVNVLSGPDIDLPSVRLECTAFVNDTAAAPAGVAFSQRLELYTSSFHGFMPEPGWLFTRDGAPAPR